MDCSSKLSLIYYVFIAYHSVCMLFCHDTLEKVTVCLHMTSRFFEIDIDSRNVVFTFFDLGTKKQYFILRQYICIVQM